MLFGPAIAAARHAVCPAALAACPFQVCQVWHKTVVASIGARQQARRRVAIPQGGGRAAAEVTAA